MGEYRQGLKVTIRLVLDGLECQAHIASFYIVLNVMAQRLSIIFLGNYFLYVLNSEVSCQWIIVVPADELCPDDSRNIKSPRWYSTLLMSSESFFPGCQSCSALIFRRCLFSSYSSDSRSLIQLMLAS